MFISTSRGTVNTCTHMVSKLIDNLYRSNDSGRTRFRHFIEGLEKIGFRFITNDLLIFMIENDLTVLMKTIILLSQHSKKRQTLYLRR